MKSHPLWLSYKMVYIVIVSLSTFCGYLIVGMVLKSVTVSCLSEGGTVDVCVCLHVSYLLLPFPKAYISCSSFSVFGFYDAKALTLCSLC